MVSTTYEHFVDVNKMYAAQEQFRGVTKMVCDFVKANKIVALRLKFEKKMQICGLNMAKCVSKRNAGQLPQQQPKRTRTVQSSFRAVLLHG